MICFPILEKIDTFPYTDSLKVRRSAEGAPDPKTVGRVLRTEYAGDSYTTIDGSNIYFQSIAALTFQEAESEVGCEALSCSLEA